MELLRQYGIVTTVWNCYDSMELLRQWGIVTTVWNCYDSMELLRQCGIFCIHFITRATRRATSSLWIYDLDSQYFDFEYDKGYYEKGVVGTHSEIYVFIIYNYVVVEYGMLNCVS
jgi:uncharacterized protein YqgQ